MFLDTNLFFLGLGQYSANCAKVAITYQASEDQCLLHRVLYRPLSLWPISSFFVGSSLIPKTVEEAAIKPSESVVVYNHRLDPEVASSELPVGQTVWPISYAIPKDCPPTFSGVTGINFKIYHWIRVTIYGKDNSQPIDEFFLVDVRAPISLSLYRQFPCLHSTFMVLFKKEVESPNRPFEAKIRFLDSFLVPGKACRLALDLQESSFNSIKVVVSLLQKISTVREQDDRWKDVALATANFNCQADFDQQVNLMIPENLSESPTLSTSIGSAEYYIRVRIIVKYFLGMRVAESDRAFKIPLAPESSLPSSTAPTGRQFYNSPSSGPEKDEEAPPPPYSAEPSVPPPKYEK